MNYIAARNLNRDEKGQTALETAIILIAFIVVATVFAFVILSAGTASTERSESAIAQGLEGVQSSLMTRGTVIGTSAGGTAVETIVFYVTLAGDEPVDLTDTSSTNVVVISYRSNDQFINELDWAVAWVGANSDGDALLEAGEQAEITVTIPAAAALAANTEFTLEVRPPAGAVLPLNATTPAALEAVMELN